jgi:hypothetical protein
MYSDIKFGYKSLYDHVEWVLAVFDKKMPKVQSNINSLQEIGKRLLSLLYK